MEYILVTGGAGYIGSHTVIELVQSGYNVIIVDNLVNSSYDAVARIEYIAKKNVKFFDININDYENLSKIFREFKIKGVIHLASLKAVGESTKIPLEYYENNIGGTVNLLKVMKENDCKTMVFSSSATVYGDVTRFDDMIPIPEHCPNDPTNPYGKTKYVIENILKDLYASDNSWRSAILRYFNPIGAHPTGLIGEDPLGIPNNLLPYLAQVAVGRREKLSVFGNDYDSHDGTPIRDYIHVVDLAKGHIAALNYLNKLEAHKGLLREWNLGTGKGSTVFDVYNAFCKAAGRDLPYEIAPRREGDVLNLTANPSRANKELEWRAELSIEDACRDLWKWTTLNPYGYQNKTYEWKEFGSVGIKNRLHTIKRDNLSISIANYGALIQNLSFGERSSIIRNFDKFEDYFLDSNPYFGSSVGRYANRIAGSKFNLDSKEYSTTINENGKNTLHSGNNGFDKQYFLGPVVKEEESKTILEFLLVDESGNDGFPGELETIVRYLITSSSVEIEFEAKLTDESKETSTIVNLTNHSYFNILNNPTIDGSKIKSCSNKILEVNPESLLPTGKIIETKKDIRNDTTLTKEDFFDYCFIVEEGNIKLDTRSNDYKQIFEVSHPDTSFKLAFLSTEPAFQFYTGDYCDTKGSSSRSGFCIEPSRYVSAISFDDWKNQVILRKGEVYGSKIKYNFSN